MAPELPVFSPFMNCLHWNPGDFINDIPFDQKDSPLAIYPNIQKNEISKRYKSLNLGNEKQTKESSIYLRGILEDNRK